jgi:hypothetical protein
MNYEWAGKLRQGNSYLPAILIIHYSLNQQRRGGHWPSLFLSGIVAQARRLLS